MVDSCVLLDIFNDDENWATWSSNILFELSKEHNLVINTVIFTEIAFNFDTYEQLDKTLMQLEIQTLDIPLVAAFNVSRLFKKYRKNKSNKKTPMPDFYIGAHASYLDVPLITRDTARFKTYQPNIKLISPEKNAKPSAPAQ